LTEGRANDGRTLQQHLFAERSREQAANMLISPTESQSVIVGCMLGRHGVPRLVGLGAFVSGLEDGVVHISLLKSTKRSVYGYDCIQG
jgi:hypothetical protein